MTTTFKTTIRAGHLDGHALWDDTLQSYAAVLSLFDDDRSYPPSATRFGFRPAEHPTVDALASHLHRRGLPVDGTSAGNLQDLRHRVHDLAGGCEVVGLVVGSVRHLCLITPSRQALALNLPVAHPAYGFSWGDNGPATVETARFIGDRLLGASPANDLDTLALTLTMDYLCDIDGDFSFDAGALCDWYLTDTPLTTALDPLDLLALRRQLSSPHPAALTPADLAGPGGRDRARP